jgi:hypothetical protein
MEGILRLVDSLALADVFDAIVVGMASVVKK